MIRCNHECLPTGRQDARTPGRLPQLDDHQRPPTFFLLGVGPAYIMQLLWVIVTALGYVSTYTYNIFPMKGLYVSSNIYVL